MKKNSKIIYLVILIVVIIAVVAIFGFDILNKNNNVEETKNSVNETNQNMQVKVNETQNNVVKNEINNVVENKMENNQVVNNTTVKEENNVTIEKPTEVLQDNGATNEEKAINIVKKDWGTTENVYFVTMGIDASGRYIVTVNQSSTTEALAWYAVDVVTGKFEIQ